MFDLISIIFLGLWLVVAIFDYCDFAYVWQLKEYRIDRLSDYFHSVQGRKFIFSYKILIRPFVFLLWVKAGWFLFIVILLFDMISFFYRLAAKKWRRPKFTAKILAILLVAVILEALILLVPLKYPVILGLIFSRFILLSLVIFLFSIPTKIFRYYYYRQAENKLKQFGNLIVIGITGSYGKSTVKEFLYQILSDKFKVLKTPKNINTEIGIAKFIMQNDFRDVQIFIVEMAAYKIGEIKQICQITHPQIGILTAINEQHLSLFGNIQNTQQAKYELLKSLPESGLAVINSDNGYIREKISEIKCKVKKFGGQTEFSPDYLVKNIITGIDGTKFTISSNGQENIFAIDIMGKHNALNITPCYAVALYLGLDTQNVLEKSKSLQLPEATIQIKKYGANTIIDDSYNSNPEGFSSALEILSNYQGQKAVITRGMLELGKMSDELHRKISAQIAKCADELVIITPDEEKSLREGAKETKLKIYSIYKTKELMEYIRRGKNSNRIILLENRVPDLISKEISAK